MLEQRGAFAKHPERRRADAEGAGAFNAEPPASLPEECVKAWRAICARLPKVSLSSSDELAVEMTARLLTDVWLTPRSVRHDPKMLAELRAWFKELGLTVQARTTLPPKPDGNDDANPFAQVRRDS